MLYFFDIQLNTYIRLNTEHDTRGKALGWTHNSDQWLNSYFNRMRNQVKVFFPSTDYCILMINANVIEISTLDESQKYN